MSRKMMINAYGGIIAKQLPEGDGSWVLKNQLSNQKAIKIHILGKCEDIGEFKGFAMLDRDEGCPYVDGTIWTDPPQYWRSLEFPGSRVAPGTLLKGYSIRKFTSPVFQKKIPLSRVFYTFRLGNCWWSNSD